MIKAKAKRHQTILGVLVILLISLLGSVLQGCQLENSGEQSNLLQQTSSNGATSTPSQTAGFLGSALAENTPTRISADDYHPVWATFPPPSEDAAITIPEPQEKLDISDEIMVWVLLGSDTEPPFTGRTPSIHLLFIHPRFSKASLVSIPGDLYVYIPGFTMQRLDTAYPIGGIETLRDTFAYNFGVRPSRFVLAHPGDFQWLVDDIGSIEVTVFYPLPHVCGGIRAGLVEMDGALALCYASFRDGMDEIDRMYRQQQLIRLIFDKFSRDGNLVYLPLLYANYQGWVRTDLSLEELIGHIPLALRLADTDRIGYYMIGWDQISLWEVPGYSQAQVFLPDQDAVRAVFQQAIDTIMIPEPLTNHVQTLEAQLTAAYQATFEIVPTPTPSPTPSPSETPIQTETPSPESTTIDIESSPTRTLTPYGYPP